MKLIDKDKVSAEINSMLKSVEHTSHCDETSFNSGRWKALTSIKNFIDTLEVKEVDVSNISENLAEAHEYLGYTSTGNLAHNKPMVSARLKKAIRGLFDAGLFELNHDKKYRMESLGLKVQKGGLTNEI